MVQIGEDMDPKNLVEGVWYSYQGICIQYIRFDPGAVLWIFKGFDEKVYKLATEEVEKEVA